jgi:hypothetical protein
MSVMVLEEKFSDLKQRFLNLKKETGTDTILSS